MQRPACFSSWSNPALLIPGHRWGQCPRDAQLTLYNPHQRGHCCAVGWGNLWEEQPHILPGAAQLQGQVVLCSHTSIPFPPQQLVVNALGGLSSP